VITPDLVDTDCRTKIVDLKKLGIGQGCDQSRRVDAPVQCWLGAEVNPDLPACWLMAEDAD